MPPAEPGRPRRCCFLPHLSKEPFWRSGRGGDEEGRGLVAAPFASTNLGGSGGESCVDFLEKKQKWVMKRELQIIKMLWNQFQKIIEIKKNK